MKAYYYIDSRGRKVLHAPFVFIVTNSKRGNMDITLDPIQLKKSFLRLRRNKKSLEKGLIAEPDIDQEDINDIIDLISCNDLGMATSYAADIFDYVTNKVCEEEGFNKSDSSDYNPKDDLYGYDPRFIPQS